MILYFENNVDLSRLLDLLNNVERRTKDSESRTPSKSKTPSKSQTPQSTETHCKSPASQSKTPTKSQTPQSPETHCKSKTPQSQTISSVQSASVQPGTPKSSTPAPHPGCTAQLSGRPSTPEHDGHLTCRDGLDGKRNRVRYRKTAARWAFLPFKYECN